MKNHPIQDTKIEPRFGLHLGTGRAWNHAVGFKKSRPKASGMRKPSRAVVLACLWIVGASMVTGDKVHAATTKTMNLSANESVTISAGNGIDITDGHGVVADGVQAGSITIASDGAIRVNTTKDSIDLDGVRILADDDNTSVGAVGIINSGTIQVTGRSNTMGIHGSAYRKSSTSSVTLDITSVINASGSAITVAGKLGDTMGVGFDSNTSSTGNSTTRVGKFTNQGAITVTVSEDSYAQTSGVDFLALTGNSGNASLSADSVVNAKGATIAATGNGDFTFGMAFTSTAQRKGSATLNAGSIVNRGGITAKGNAADVLGIGISGRTEGEGKTTIGVNALSNEGTITVNGNTIAPTGKGKLEGQAAGIEVEGEVTGSADAYVRVGSITNAAGGVIDASGEGSKFIRGTSLQSTTAGTGNAHVEVAQFTNSGRITAKSNKAKPIAMDFYARSTGKGKATLRITGNITNEAGGSVLSDKSGIAFDTKGGNTTGGAKIIVDGSLINQGTIESENEDAIYVGFGTTITGGIVNTGTLQGKLGAIYVENDDSTVVPTITLSGDSARVIGVIDAASSVVTVRGQTSDNHFVPEGDIYAAGFVIDATGAMKITNDSHRLDVTNGFENRGTLEVPVGKTAKITGNYAQTGGGTYISEVGANGTSFTHGTLNVTKDVDLGNRIRVDITDGATDLLKLNEKKTIGNVLTYGGAATNTGAISVTSNNLLIDFGAVDDKKGKIQLDATRLESYGKALLPSENTAGGTEVADIAAVLGSVLDTATEGGSELSQDLQQVVEKLGNSSASGRVKILEEIKTTSTATVGSSVAVQVGSGFSGVMQNRVAALTGPDGMTTGLAAGDSAGGVSWWLQPYGGVGSQDDKGGVAGYDMDTRGLVLGFDRPLSPKWYAGLAVSYTNTDVDANTGTQSVDIDTYQIGAYGTRELTPDTRLDVQAGIGRGQYDSLRAIPSLGRVAKVDYDSTNFMGGLSLEKDYPISTETMVRANLSAEYSYVNVDGYTEEGAGALDLKISSTDQDSLILGVGGEYRYAPLEEGIFSLRGMLGYDALADQSSVSTQLVAGGAAFTTKGMEPERFLFRGGLGYEFQAKDNIIIDVRYDTELRQGFDNHAASVKLKYVY
uniref:Outer membrane autotransporter barrel domain-containing protein n=1 Tax=Candidatus Kentrum sp. LFY TaxID=2126342 RepID=A0A450UH39_9GAMM|nr:MAG: outer membrane autotransporter barrel domain-containing protein [Candidatus Kentron sp. LFY]